MDYRYLNVSIDDGIVTTQIANMDRKNSVNDELNAEIVDVLEQLERDPSLRVFVLTGSEGIFCSGGDISVMTAREKAIITPTPSVRDKMEPHDSGIRRLVLRLRQVSKPTIAAINGHAVGSGVGLALGCDIRIASTAARIGWVFTRRGIVPDDGSLWLMPQVVGYQQAFHWGITGRTLSADEAHGIGFCHEVVAPDDLLTTCHTLAREIIENCPPMTAELFKLSLVQSYPSADMTEALAAAHTAQTVAYETEDHREALRAYKEKRAPRWVAR